MTALKVARFGVAAVDARAAVLDEVDKIKEQALDPYATFRSLSRQHRESQIEDTRADERATVPSLVRSARGRTPMIANLSRLRFPDQRHGTVLTMVTRRSMLGFAASGLVLAALGRACPAFAQSTDQASGFIERTSKELTTVVNGGGAVAQRQAALQQIIDRSVDVNEVGRFCLGRFWRTASPQQQHDYIELFHRVLVNNITSKVGDYQGVSIALGHSAAREGDVAVTTTVTRPGNAPSRVDWLVSTASGSPKIIDVIAEGTSLRLTQRSDYSAYLARNNNSVQALIDAMRQQAGSPS